MPTIKLTKRNIESLPVPVIGQVIYRDSDLPGYGLLAGTRTRSFFVEGQIGRRTVRASIGRYPRILPERARVLVDAAFAQDDRLLALAERFADDGPFFEGVL